MTNFCDKYKASCFADIKGQDSVIKQVQKFIEDFPIKRALILHGPTGTGKTSLAYALASETKAEIIELNASDLRNKEQIRKILGHASQQASLFKNRKVVLVDEVDGITKDDSGGLPELISLIKETKFPVIITANNIWESKFSELRRNSELLQLKELGYKVILEILEKISANENLNIDKDVLINLAIKSRGDVRAGINDLQTITRETKHKEIYERDKEESIFNIMKQIFQQMPAEETIRLYDRVNMPLDDILLWLEENLPKEYQGEELCKAIEAMSKADVFRGRIYRQQHWRFLVYQNFFMSAGISAAKKKAKTGFVSYKKPSRILKIWMLNQKQKYKKSIAGKYSKHTHTNTKRAMREFPLIKQILKNPNVQKELRLDEQEILFLENSN